MKKIEVLIIKILLKLRIGKIIAKAFKGVEGYKTYIALILVALLKFFLYSGFIPEIYKDIVNEIINALWGAIAISFGDKIKRYWEAIKKTGDEIIK